MDPINPHVPPGALHAVNVNRTTTNTNVVRVERIGQTLNVSLDGVQRWTTTTNIVSRIRTVVFAAEEAGSNNIIDNFSCGGVTDNFSNANSPNWKFYYEIQPVGVPVGGNMGTPTLARWNAVAQVISGGITNGVMRLGPVSSGSGELMGEALAEFTQPLTGDFVLQFDIRKTQTTGHFLIYFPVSAATSTSVPGGPVKPAFVTTLRRKFNKRTGKMGVIKNGIMTHRGYLKFLPNQRLNRRQVLRGYR